jgi:type VI secretion system protein ImpH
MPRRLGFFETVALLERLIPGAARVGELDPARESMRFKHDPSLAFSVSDVAGIRRLAGPREAATGHPVYEITTTFLGLTGAASSIPAYVSETVLDEDHRPLRDFLDIFHHRLLSLLYRELASLRPWAEQTSALDDAWSSRLLSLAGLDIYEAPATLPIPKQRLLRLLPFLARRVRGSQSLAVAVQDVLADLLGDAGVHVREFAGGWSDVPPAEQTQLGIRNTVLGEETLLGSQVPDPAGAFEIHVGPLSHDVFKLLADPGGPISQIHALAGLWTSDPLEYRVIVSLAAGQVPQLVLGTAEGGRLGCDTWLGRTTDETPVMVYPSVGQPPASSTAVAA